jgi:hypothetical protein
MIDQILGIMQRDQAVIWAYLPSKAMDIFETISCHTRRGARKHRLSQLITAVTFAFVTESSLKPCQHTVTRSHATRHQAPTESLAGMRTLWAA